MRIGSLLNVSLGACLALLVVASVSAQTRGDVKKTMEASLLVTGDITISTSGGVSEFKIDTPEKLPKEVVELINAAVPGWKFEPVVRDGAAVQARSRMSLRLVASKREDGNYLLAIRSAAFNGAHDEVVDDVWLSKQKMTPPRYPDGAAQAGVGGTVYLIIKVRRDGHVEEAFAEQTNLRVVANEREMARWRKTFEQAALVAARKWSFTLPLNGASEADGSWTARVPVEYALTTNALAYGAWSPYIPGPRVLAPWVKPEFARAQDIDAGQGGSLAPVGTGIRLETDLSQG